MKLNSNYTKKLSENYNALKKGSKLIINNKYYTVKFKHTSKNNNHFDKNEILFELGNNYFLDYNNNKLAFLQTIDRKRLFSLIIFTIPQYLKIESIKIIK